MKLIHYSKERLSHLYSVPDQLADPLHGWRAWKPRGLWLSIEGNGDGWLDWVRSEDWRVDQYTIGTELELLEPQRVLHISSVGELDDFSNQYVARQGTIVEAPDWQRVAASYKGIIIAPYIYERRLSCDWYYPWDCASGCVWDVSCLRIVQ